MGPKDVEVVKDKFTFNEMIRDVQKRRKMDFYNPGQILRKSKALEDLWIFKASRGHEIAMGLSAMGSRFRFFPQKATLEQQGEALRNDVSKVDNDFLRDFLHGAGIGRIASEEASGAELAEFASGHASTCFAASILLLFCWEMYERDRLKEWWRIVRDVEHYSTDAILDASEYMGWSTAKLEEMERKSSRLQKSIEALKNRKSMRKQPVLETYYRSKKIDPSLMSKHSIARAIKKELDKEFQLPASVNTIKRYLKEEGLID